MSTSARFGAPSDVKGIVRFSSNDLTEAPGCVVGALIDRTTSVTTANGQSKPKRTIFSSIQLAPEELWEVALEQAVAAADNVGLRVISSLPFGEGDRFGITATAPAMPKLDGMTAQDLMAIINDRPFGGHDYLGPVFMALAAVMPVLRLDRQSPIARDIDCVIMLQGVAARLVTTRNDSSYEKMRNNRHSMEPLTVSEHQ